MHVKIAIGCRYKGNVRMCVEYMYIWFMTCTCIQEHGSGVTIVNQFLNMVGSMYVYMVGLVHMYGGRDVIMVRWLYSWLAGCTRVGCMNTW